MMLQCQRCYASNRRAENPLQVSRVYPATLQIMCTVYASSKGGVHMYILVRVSFARGVANQHSWGVPLFFLYTCTYVTGLRKNGLIAGLAKIDFFSELASTKLRYCLSKI